MRTKRLIFLLDRGSFHRLNPLYNLLIHLMYYTERLKWVRDCKNITQKEIADFLNIKQQQYARYEKGVNAMPITYLKDICKYLDVSADYIIGLTDEMNPCPKEK